MNNEAISDIQSPKKSFLQRLPQLFINLKKIFTIKKDYSSDEFSDYSIGASTIDKAFDDVKAASQLCESASAIASSRISLVANQQELLIQKQNLDKIDNLTDEEIETLTKFISQYESVNKEKSVIKHQMGGVDRSLDYMVRYEDELPKALADIKEAEDRQRLIKQDIGFLEGEKASLEYDKNTLETGLDFIYKLSIFLICIFALATVILVYLNTIIKTNIFIYISTEIFLAIFFGTSIYILRRKMRFELKKNILFQIKVVELLNKRKLHYVHHTRYLNYEFKKYHVKSADMLKNNWDEYCHYKHLSGRFKAVNNIIYDITDDIQRFLAKKDIIETKFTIDNIAKSLDKNKNKRSKKEIEIEKKKCEAKLKELDEKQEAIWKQLQDLRENDTTDDHIISKMIQNYLDEIGALAPTIPTLE